MLGLRMPELLLILAVVVLLFGAKKLPALGAGLGNGIRGFKRALSGADAQAVTAAEPRPPA